MDNAIKAIDRDSPLAGKVCPGDTLLAINSNKILDVLDYKFFAYDTRLELRLRRPGPSHLSHRAGRLRPLRRHVRRASGAETAGAGRR